MAARDELSIFRTAPPDVITYLGDILLYVLTVFDQHTYCTEPIPSWPFPCVCGAIRKLLL